MPSTSRPAKVACLSCRASKIRCDGHKPCATCIAHQGECHYQASRRGGARRGPVAAEELARKRAQRLANIASLNNYERAPILQNQAYHYQSHPDSNSDFSSSSLFIIEPGIEPITASSDRCNSLGFLSPLGSARDTQDTPENVCISTWSLRSYECDEDLLNAYYVFIHPYFPLLPPPAVPQREDKFLSLEITSFDANPSALPYWPSSPVALAISALLALVPPIGKAGAFEDDSFAIRRSYANMFARSALENSENSLELSCRDESAKRSRGTFHPLVPLGVGGEQFVILLSIIPPLITFDDPRITTKFPEFRGCREPWPLLVNAQVALLRSCCIGRQLLVISNDTSSLPASLREDIQELEYFILELAAECDRFRCITNYQGPEADASRSLWAISNALIHTSRLTLHRVRAFPDRPVFHGEYWDFLAVNTVSRPAHHFHLSASHIARIDTVFPFTERESVKVCLHSALIISRIFRRLPSPNTTYSDISETENNAPRAFWRGLSSPRSIPYMGWCQLQSFYTLHMVLWRVRTALSSGNLSSYLYLLDQPSATTQVQDAERLMEELESGMEVLGRSIQADGVFEGVRSMAKEVERTYEATNAIS
ncbi:Zn(II)2Cys6 transcription factor [Penicillium angulare]|uniref:Zn(II)2Cys6 transcription factor n=1 Tax=Penicillium angulare TaxID=116970 RepID=A0A9W9FVX3_9EURO|nr:Zn(II)2Cys6 transcription factor [Penicillium angulare]